MARETVNQKTLTGYGSQVRKPVYTPATPQQSAAALAAQKEATDNGTFSAR